MPLFYAPGPEEENDGKRIPGDDVDPAGYPLVNAVRLDGNMLDKGTGGLDLYDRTEGEAD